MRNTNNNFWPFSAIITFLVITWFKCRFDAWCEALTKIFSFFIVSKWRLVWHLSKLETFTVKLQRYFMKRDLAHLQEGVITKMLYLCNFTMKVSNFDKCQTRRHFETILSSSERYNVVCLYMSPCLLIVWKGYGKGGDLFGWEINLLQIRSKFFWWFLWT